MNGLNTCGIVLSLILITMTSCEAFTTRPAVRSTLKKPYPTKRTFRPPPTAGSSFNGPCNPWCKDCPPPNLTYCSVIGSTASADDASDSGSEISFDSTESKTGLFGGRFQRRSLNLSNLKENLLKVSNWASLLCVLDCTILPIVTFILPLFGIVAASPAQMEWLHEAGHQVALYFVLPVGGLATTMNYTQHKKFWITAIGWLGLLAVVSANAGCHFVHDIPGPVGHFLHHWLHVLHHGLIHRVTNLTGCFLLISSNYLSHKQGTCKDPACTHDH